VLDPVLAGALRGLERLVGDSQDLLERLARRRQGDDPDAESDGPAIGPFRRDKEPPA
jgi:hypothetical protein